MSRQSYTALQKQLAEEVVKSSELGRKIGQSIVQPTHNYLGTVRLDDFSTNDPNKFQRALDRHTNGILALFPNAVQHWAIAHNVLNLFLKEALYNKDLNNEFKLATCEYWLEIPLDQKVARKLRSQDNSLPPWQVITNLTKSDYDEYQGAAQKIAGQRGIPRVRLDLYL